MKLGDRVRLDGIPGTVVARLDRWYVEVEFDEPAPAISNLGDHYLRSCASARIEHVHPIIEARPW